MDINQAKEVVIRLGIELVERGLIARTWGNISQRIDSNTMAISPSGKSYLSLTLDDIVVVDINTLEYQGSIKPSSEKGIHANCYKHNDKINTVIHTHQEYASILSACDVDYVELDQKVFLAPYALPSTKKLCNNVTKVLGSVTSNSLILKNHGALCFGVDYKAALDETSALEAKSKHYIESKYVAVTNSDEYDNNDHIDYILNKFKLSNTPSNQEVACGEYLLNDSKEVVALSNIGLMRPYVDDFSQIIGTKVVSVENDKAKIVKALKSSNAVFVKGIGAVCAGPTLDDQKAVSMILEKNCKIFFGANLFGKVKPINIFESKLMNTVYKLKYSKQIN